MEVNQDGSSSNMVMRVTSGYLAHAALQRVLFLSRTKNLNNPPHTHTHTHTHILAFISKLSVFFNFEILLWRLPYGVFRFAGVIVHNIPQILFLIKKGVNLRG